MGILASMPTAASPVDRLLAQFDRGQIEGFIEVAISLLDIADGDPDLEMNGDEQDTTFAEDGFCEHNAGGIPYPGCPVADPSEASAWTEWHTRGRHKLGHDGEEQCRTIGIPNMAHEDAEEDDAAEANGDEHDTGNAEDEGLTESARRDGEYFYPGPGCSVADCGERDLGAPEASAGRWGSHLVVGDDTDDEPWVVPATLNPPGAENDR